MNPTDVSQLMTELGSGVFENKLGVVISEVATAVLDHGKVGEVTIKLKMIPAGSANQLQITHTLAYKRPKKRGNIGEDDSQETILFVNEGGNITMFPENQVDMFQDLAPSKQENNDVG